MNKKHRTRQMQPRRLTPFERETERRRKEMIRNLSGGVIHTNHIPTSRLKIYIRDGVKVVMGADKKGNPLPLTKRHLGGYSNRNFWRGMMTKPSRKAEAA